MRGIEEEETNLVYLVPELCYITGLDKRLRSNLVAMNALSSRTEFGPTERLNALTNHIESVRSKLFGLKIFLLCYLNEL